MISIESSDKPDSNWNTRLLNSETGTIFQTKELACYHQQSLKWKPFFLKFINQNGKIVGQILIESRKRFEAKNNKNQLLKRIPGTKKEILTWNYGPVIFDKNYSTEIITKFRDYLIKQKSKIIGFEHPLSSGILSDFGKPFRIEPRATFLIDLSLGQEKIWQNMKKHSTRKNIERSQKKGVYTKLIDKNNLIDYYNLLRETKKKVGIDLSFSDTKIQWKKLSSVGFGGFLAYKDENPIGGLLVSFFNNYVNEWGVSRSEKDEREKLYSQDLIKWKIIDWGISNKFRYYDLSGVNPKPQNEKESGIFRYKEKFGGKFFRYYKIFM